MVANRVGIGVIQFFDPTSQKLVKLLFCANCFFPNNEFKIMRKRFITSNNESEQIIKQAHRIHVCLIIFLIHYFDIINMLKSDKIHYILIQ